MSDVLQKLSKTQYSGRGRKQIGRHRNRGNSFELMCLISFTVTNVTLRGEKWGTIRETKYVLYWFSGTYQMASPGSFLVRVTVWTRIHPEKNPPPNQKEWYFCCGKWSAIRPVNGIFHILFFLIYPSLFLTCNDFFITE